MKMFEVYHFGNYLGVCSSIEEGEVLLQRHEKYAERFVEAETLCDLHGCYPVELDNDYFTAHFYDEDGLEFVSFSSPNLVNCEKYANEHYREGRKIVILPQWFNQDFATLD